MADGSAKFLIELVDKTPPAPGTPVAPPGNTALPQTTALQPPPLKPGPQTLTQQVTGQPAQPLLPLPLPVSDPALLAAVSRLALGTQAGATTAPPIAPAPTTGAAAPTPAKGGKEPKSLLDSILDQMERDERAQEMDFVRRQIDPAYAMKKEREEQRTANQEARSAQSELDRVERQRKEAERERAQKEKNVFTSVKGGFDTAGMTGIGGIVGAAGGGPVSAALVGVGMLGDMAKGAANSVREFALAFAQGDPMALGRGFANLLGNVPLVGGALSGLANTVFDISDGIEKQAHQLARFSPEISIQLAEMEVRNLEREMERARTMGPEIVRALEQRQNAREAFQDMLDEYMPQILRFGAVMMSLMQVLVNVTLEGLKNNPVTKAFAEGVLGKLEQVVNNTTPQPSGQGIVGYLWEAFGDLNFQNAPRGPQAPAPAGAAQFPAARPPAGGLFGAGF